MAKQRQINGKRYRPKKQFAPNTKCTNCNRTITRNLAFFCDEDKTDVLCLGCMNTLTKNNAELLIKEATPFPKEETLYVGTKSHKCGNGQDVLEKVVFLFGEENVNISIKKCKICGSYVIRHQDYEKHYATLKEYKLINSKTNKPFPEMHSSEGGSFSYRKEIPKPAEAPPHIQWAAMHPFSGGSFTPK